MMKMNVWAKAPKTQVYEATGRAPIGTRWVEVDKGDRVRSRLVDREIKRDSNYEMFVATPPIEYDEFV